MAVKPLLTANDTYRRMKKSYLTVNGIYRKVKKAYETRNGVWRLAWSSGLERILTRTLGTAKSNSGAASFSNAAFVAGGYSGDNASIPAVVAVYDNNHTLYNPEALQKGRYEIASISDDRMDDNVCFAGGYDSLSTGLSGTYIDVYNSDWTKEGDCPNFPSGKGRYGAAGCAVFGYFYIGGGLNKYNSEYYNTVYELNPNAWTLREIGTLLAKSHRGAAANTDVYGVFAGGQTSSSNYHAKVSAFDSMGVSIDEAPELLSNYKAQHAGARVENNVIFAGGKNSSSAFASADAYDRLVTKIDGIEPLSVARYSLSGVSFGEYAAFVGGRGMNSIYNTIDVYDEDLTLVEDPVIELSEARSLVGVAATKNFMYASGGQNGSNTSALSNVFDIFTN